MKQAKNCAYILCNEPFIAERKDQIYCDKGTCKMAAHRLKKAGFESTELSEVLSRARDAELQWHGVGGDKTREAKRRREDALRAAYDAIGAELGIVQQSVVLSNEPANELDEAENEPENEATQDPLTPALVREKLRAFMAETSFGQSKIAKLAGVGQPTISLFLAGKTDGSDAFRRSILDVVTQDHGMDRR